MRERGFSVLIVDPVGLAPGPDGQADTSEVRAHVEAAGAGFVEAGASAPARNARTDRFFYRPDLHDEAELIRETCDGRYDAVIAAATTVPVAARFPGGGVRIGAGVGNMRSASWGGPNGSGGAAPLMNTPGINARATAQMVMKTLMRWRPDLPTDLLHRRALVGHFDTGRDLSGFHTVKLEAMTMAVLGYGAIGREVAQLAAAFGMKVRVFARPNLRSWVESEGFEHAATACLAAQGADVLSIHLGLGRIDPDDGQAANANLVGREVLAALNDNAVLINFDRGELVETLALEEALATGKIACAAIDADIFHDLPSNAVSGPLSAYLPLAERYETRVLLSPHAAADTDHPTRVAGAKLAVDLILGALRRGEVYNRVGDLPAGYVDCGTRTPLGVGPVRPQRLRALAERPEGLKALANDACALAGFYEALGRGWPSGLESAITPAEAIAAGNRLGVQLRRLGLLGPYEPARSGAGGAPSFSSKARGA